MPDYIVEGKAPLLESKGEASYHIARDKECCLYLKVTERTGGGECSILGKPIYFCELFDCIFRELLDRIGSDSDEGQFGLSVLNGAVPSKNTNDPFVVGAVLVHIGFIERITWGKYRLGSKTP